MPSRRTPHAARRIVHLFTEGEITEPEYFDWLKKRQSTFTIKVDDRHGPPQRLLELAINLQKESRSRTSGLPKYDSIWCVFDRDSHTGVDETIDKAKRLGISVAFSHPCFEYWVLLHFCNEAAPCAGNCTDVTGRLERYLARYRKSVPVHQLKGRFPRAKEWAVRVSAQHDRDGVILATQRDPSTNVWEFVDRIGVTY